MCMQRQMWLQIETQMQSELYRCRHSFRYRYAYRCRDRDGQRHTQSQTGVPGGSAVNSPPAVQEMRDSSSIPGSGRSPGGGHR